MGARSDYKASIAIEEIKRELPDADIRFLRLNLNCLDSVIDAAVEIRENTTQLHGLINNAGIMNVPYSVTPDDYEIQFQV
jgi:NAD(P)-dependent dehydrogenase (short-subunit alcohol dehydrogenase family)